MVFADDAAKMNRVLDRMNLDFVKAESGSMVTKSSGKGDCLEKTENQMEKESRECTDEDVILPENKINLNWTMRKKCSRSGDEAFPEEILHRRRRGRKESIRTFLAQRNTSSDQETGWKKKNEKPSCAERTRRYPQGARRNVKEAG